MPLHRYFLSDFVEIQRKSFFHLLEKGLIEEFSKRNPITNSKKTLELFFYTEYYQLTAPAYNPREAIIKSKSYFSRLYIPVQLTDKKSKIIKLKWVYIGDLPLMTKRGHFILNGAARVIVNQILRSPGIYYQKKIYENYANKWSQKVENSFDRYYADLICQRGTWLRIEMDKDKQIWAQMKRGPKIPILWFLIAMGIPEKVIFKSIQDPSKLLLNIQEDPSNKNKKVFTYVKNPPQAWSEIYSLFSPKKLKKSTEKSSTKDKTTQLKNLFSKKQSLSEKLSSNENSINDKSNLGRKWIFNKFMNPRTYDLGKQGRLNLNKKLGLSVSVNQTTLTAQDVLYATDHLIKVEKGFKKVDDIDHLKNRRVRTSGELIQIQLGTGLVRLEKIIRDKMNKISSQIFINPNYKPRRPIKIEKLTISNLMNTKPFNGSLREFFGTSPLSQFMDQINPLAELTHKRRLSSMGPGGVTRDSATLAIRGIHPTHYGRICPIETPEGKNTGLVNSLTAYARVNSQGFIETPFYKVYKGQVQKKAGMYYFSAEQEEKIKLAAADLFTSKIGFLPKANIPVRISEEFTKIPRNSVEFVGVSPIQMISIATSLIPFLEHDDANRALMGSNMQRQAVPILKPERPIVGTGLEALAACDSGHVLQAKYSGVVTYVSSTKIIVHTLND